MIWLLRGAQGTNAANGSGWTGCVIAAFAGSIDHRSIRQVKTWPMCCWLGAGVALENAAAGLDVTAIATA